MNTYFSGGSMLRITVLALAALFGPAAVRPEFQASETELKAAWLYNFVQHVEWPAAAFRDEKARSSSRSSARPRSRSRSAAPSAASRPRADGRDPPRRPLSELKGAHVAFIPDGEKDRLDQVLAAVHGTPVLVVGESDGLTRRGAAFNFYSEDTRVRFEANVENATRAGLTVSSKLLKFARLVKD